MADVILSDEKEITFDLSKMTIKQYRGMFDTQEDDNKTDETLARVAGMTLEDLQSLPFPDYRKVARAFFTRCRQPDADPNA
jgi:hypothetical protein